MFIFVVIICCVCTKKCCFNKTTPSQTPGAPHRVSIAQVAKAFVISVHFCFGHMCLYYQNKSSPRANTSAPVQQHPSHPVSRHTARQPATTSTVSRPLVCCLVKVISESVMTRFEGATAVSVHVSDTKRNWLSEWQHPMFQWYLFICIST